MLSTWDGTLLSHRGIAKGHKAYGVKGMPAPTNVQKLRSFLGSVQFYNKFLPNLSCELVNDHRPLLALFGPSKEIPTLAANRLARWALMLNQYDYNVEYRKSSQHGNADALSQNPVGEDSNFDREESGADIDTVCTVRMISRQINPVDP